MLRLEIENDRIMSVETYLPDWEYPLTERRVLLVNKTMEEIGQFAIDPQSKNLVPRMPVELELSSAFIEDDGVDTATLSILTSYKEPFHIYFKFESDSYLKEMSHVVTPKNGVAKVSIQSSLIGYIAIMIDEPILEEKMAIVFVGQGVKNP